MINHKLLKLNFNGDCIPFGIRILVLVDCVTTRKVRLIDGTKTESKQGNDSGSVRSCLNLNANLLIQNDPLIW